MRIDMDHVRVLNCGSIKDLSRDGLKQGSIITKVTRIHISCLLGRIPQVCVTAADDHHG